MPTASLDWPDIYKTAGLDKHQAKRVKDAFFNSGVFRFATAGQIWTYL
jgi:hypothetical protein